MAVKRLWSVLLQYHYRYCGNFAIRHYHSHGKTVSFLPSPWYYRSFVPIPTVITAVLPYSPLPCHSLATTQHVYIAAFYWARELLFIRNKLIVFMTSRELSHYVVFSRIIAEGKKAWFSSQLFFSFYVHIPDIFTKSCIYIFCVWKMKQIFLLI